MHAPIEEARRLYEEALKYDESGDVYNAIKLYKRVVKLADGWFLPYSRLQMIYKARQEWKPAYHYTKRALALDTKHTGLWWDLGIAATALKKWRIAKSVWNKFAAPFTFPENKRSTFSICLTYNGQFELIWVRPLCPARAEILSIPQPESQRCYGDLILYDRRELKGYNVANNRKMPIFDYLGLWKHSKYSTFSCWLHTDNQKDVQALETLCQNAGMGFENWSNNTWNSSKNIRKKKPEFYNLPELNNHSSEKQWIAIAAISRREVEKTLGTWQLISLKEYSDLSQY